MLLQEIPLHLIDEIGHDGMVIPDRWKHLTPPDCFLGHHIQEIVDCFFRRGYALSMIEPNPGHVQQINFSQRDAESSVEGFFTTAQQKTRIQRYLKNPAIIILKGHAVAWDGERVYDPNGRIYEDDWFIDHEIVDIWIMSQIESK